MLSNDYGNGMVMPVAPAYAGGGGGFGNTFGGDWAWILLLLLIAGNGFGFGGGFGGMGGFAADGAMLYPWMNQSQQINDGFRDQMINGNISSIQNGITSGFGDVQNSLCSGFAGVNASINGAQNAVTQQMYTNQIADLERSFASQTAVSQGMNTLQSQLAQCCCDNRAATADLKYTVATEACADRNAISSALRDVLDANSASTQRILDQMCADKIDAKNEKIADLERQLTMANLAASQTAQTSRILADNAAQTVALEQYLNPAPIPAYVVQNPSCCSPNYGCGCAA